MKGYKSRPFGRGGWAGLRGAQEGVHERGGSQGLLWWGAPTVHNAAINLLLSPLANSSIIKYMVMGYVYYPKSASVHRRGRV